MRYRIQYGRDFDDPVGERIERVRVVLGKRDPAYVQRRFGPRCAAFDGIVEVRKEYMAAWAEQREVRCRPAIEARRRGGVERACPLKLRPSDGLKDPLGPFVNVFSKGRHKPVRDSLRPTSITISDGFPGVPEHFIKVRRCDGVSASLLAWPQSNRPAQVSDVAR